jgi:hypothetical protein
MIGQQAKEFYPEVTEIDFRLAGCFWRLGKVVEMEYYLQNIKHKKEQINSNTLELFLPLSKLI